MSYGYQDREFRRSAVEFDDTVRTRTITRSPAPPPPRSRRDYEERDIDVRIRERESDVPDFLRARRAPESGPMVLRQREVETYDRHPRDPSPLRYREERIVHRSKSVSPPQVEHERERERSRTRVVERIRSPSVVRRRSPSPSARSVRYVEPSDSEHIRIVERERERERERVPSPSPSPSPPPQPQVIRGPIIQREVITHYTDVDHGVIQARPPTPPPPARPRLRERETRETDIDISLSKNRTEVDIHRSTSRTRSRSRERRSRHYEDDIVVRRELKVEDAKTTRRRAHSDAVRPVDDEAEYIASKLDSRGHMGEAWGGATKNWSIVDVPPGTERIRMDGVGGGSTDTTWTKYSGVRRTKFVPEREVLPVAKAPTPPPASRADRDRDRLSVSVFDREREIDIEKITDRRITRSPQPPPPPPPKEMWTEITKDLVVREAIDQLGYEYEETDWFFYIMDYLKYDDVLQLTELSEDIRRSKSRRARERYERDYWDEYDRRHYDHQPRRQHRRDDGRVVETEVIYDSRGPSRGYR